MSTETKGGLAKKLSAVMAGVSRVPKNGINKHFNYNYATASDVYDTVRALLGEHGVAFIPSIKSHENIGGKLYSVTFLMRFVDGASGEEYQSEWVGLSSDTQDKGISKAATSAIKYFLLGMFLISTGDEPDTDQDAPREDVPREYTKRRTGPSPMSPKAALLKDAILMASTETELTSVGGKIASDVTDKNELAMLRTIFAGKRNEIEELERAMDAHAIGPDMPDFDADTGEVVGQEAPKKTVTQKAREAARK